MWAPATYRNVHETKAGGAAFTVKAMGGQLECLSDFTIVDPPGTSRSLLGFLGGDMDRVEVIARRWPIPDWAAQGDYENDPEFRRRIQEWVSEIWTEKDALIESRL